MHVANVYLSEVGVQALVGPSLARQPSEVNCWVGGWRSAYGSLQWVQGLRVEFAKLLGVDLLRQRSLCLSAT